MTASKLFVQRLYVLTRNGEIAYDEQFHRGVNIIRGDNSSGKSTITHLLFYGLGGSYIDFVPQAKQCQYVYVEVCISDCVLTLKRDIKLSSDYRVESMSGMYISWGCLDDVLDDKCDVHFFGYKATEKTKSFSNVLFELLGFPQVVGDNNITIHQLLRLMYIDQESPTSSLFMYEVFDSQITREAVAELMMGIYDSELYTAKLELRKMRKQLSDIKVEIKAVKAALPRAEESSSAFLQSVISSKENEINELTNSINIKRSGNIVKTPKISIINIIKKKVSDLRQKVKEQEDKVEIIKNEIDDTTLFIIAFISVPLKLGRVKY